MESKESLVIPENEGYVAEDFVNESLLRELSITPDKVIA